MTTLYDLMYDMSDQQDRSGSLQEAFSEAFDLEGWQFVQQGSIPYGILPGRDGHDIHVTAIQNGGGFEWQLNGISFLFAADSDLPLEERRQRLVDAARRAGYVPPETETQQGSK